MTCCHRGRREEQPMTEPDNPQQPPSVPPPQAGQPYESAPYGYAPPPPPGYGQPPVGYPGQAMPAPPPYAQYAQPQGPPGRIRPTGMIMLLFFVTLGIWGLVWW